MIGSIGEFLLWTVIVVIDILFILLTMSVARGKGHNPLGWGLLAVFLPVIALIIVLLIPTRNPA